MSAVLSDEQLAEIERALVATLRAFWKGEPVDPWAMQEVASALNVVKATRAVMAATAAP